MGNRGWSEIVRKNRKGRLKRKWQETMTPEMHKDALTILTEHTQLLIELRRYLVQGTWHEFQKLLTLGIEGATRELRQRQSLFQDAFNATFKLDKDSTEAKCIYKTVFGKIDTFYLTPIKDQMHTLAEGKLRDKILEKLKGTSEHLQTLQKELDQGLSADNVRQKLSEEGSEFILDCMSLTTE